MAESSGDGISGAAVAAVVTVLATALLGWLTPFWGWLWGALRTLGTHLVAANGWPNWIAYLLTLISLHAATSVAVRWMRSNNETYQRFDQLTFLGGVWRWRYISGHIHALAPYCPDCDTLMVYEEVSGSYSGIAPRIRFHCEHCVAVRIDQPGNLYGLQGRVEREIDRLLRTGEWRQHVPKLP